MSYARAYVRPRNSTRRAAPAAPRYPVPPRAPRSGTMVSPKIKMLGYSKSPVQPRRPKKEVRGQEAEFVSKKLTYGRKPKNNFQNLSRFVRGNISRTVFGMHEVSAFGGVSGKQFLTHTQTVAGQPIVAPLHLYDLTGVVNSVDGAITTPNTGWFLKFSSELPSAEAAFAELGINKDLKIEASPNQTTIVQNYPGPSSIMRWAQARMIFYAPTSVPSKIRVQFVQFIDEELCPATTIPADKTLTARASAWYQSYMKSQMFSPIETTQSLAFKGIKVLHSEVFIMNPKSSDEQTSTHYKQLDIFKWMNRKCNYLWNQTTGTNLQNDDPSQNTGENQTSVHPRARIFLLITGQSGKTTTGDSVTVNPSYDLVIRTQHEQLNA